MFTPSVIRITILVLDFSSRKRLKFVGVGGAPCTYVATHVKGDAAIDAIVNGSGGFVSDEFKRTGAHNVMLDSGMEIGVRFDKSYTFTSAEIG